MAEQRVAQGPAAKLSRPTHVGVETRFVFWKLITTDRDDRVPREQAEDEQQRQQEHAGVLSPSLLDQATGDRRTGACADGAACCALRALVGASACSCGTAARAGRATTLAAEVGSAPASMSAWTCVLAAFRSASMSAFLSVSTAWTTGSSAA